MIIKKNLIIIFLISFFMVQNSLSDHYIPGSKQNWLFIGTELGLQEKSNVESPEVKNDGEQMGIKVAYSKYWEELVADAGLGYRYDKMDDEVEVETKAFIVELGLRYRLTDRWSLGPEIQVLVGQDVSFSDVGTNSDDKPSAFFLGGRALYDFSDFDSEYMFRAGAQFLTDIDINDRKITYFQFLAEVGWPFGEKYKRLIKRKKKRAKKKLIKFEMKDFGVAFETGSSQLDENSKQVIIKLANVLKKYSSNWSQIKISGHTDSRGNAQKNMKLSKNRARAVRSVLIASSIDSSRIEAKGFGSSRPLDPSKTKKAHALNRRVELEVVGQNPSEDFIQQINDVLSKKVP